MSLCPARCSSTTQADASAVGRRVSSSASIAREQLAILPLDDVAAAPLLAQLTEDERFASWRLAHRDGSLRGYLGVRGRLPDALYRAIAERRDLLGRLVPDGPAPRRYP